MLYLSPLPPQDVESFSSVELVRFDESMRSDDILRQFQLSTLSTAKFDDDEDSNGDHVHNIHRALSLSHQHSGQQRIPVVSVDVYIRSRNDVIFRRVLASL